MIIEQEKQVLTDTTLSNTVSVPLVRIYTCGGLHIEVLQQAANTLAQARYAVPSVLQSAVQEKGMSSAYTLLKMLISAPRRLRSRDWIRENWHPTDDFTKRINRIDNIASLLRKLLSPPSLQGEQRAAYRRTIVRCVSGSPTSGMGYALAAYPLIWIDVDAIDWNVKQACRMERFGDDAFPYWERAYHLASQGLYLPEDRYSDWTETRRLSVSHSLRQSVHALSRLSLERSPEQGHAEVIHLLQDYLLHFPTDEDALRFLMELLGWQERFQEVEQLFLRTRRHVEDDGFTLDARTLDVWDYLHGKQLRRQRLGEHPYASEGRISFSSHENPTPHHNSSCLESLLKRPPGAGRGPVPSTNTRKREGG